MTTEPKEGKMKSIIETIVSDTYEKSPVKDRKIILEIRETATRYISEAINKASQASREELAKDLEHKILYQKCENCSDILELMRENKDLK